MMHPPEPGTMAAELFGDTTALSDDRLRHLQALSDAPGFRCTGMAGDFDGGEISGSWLVITKKGWSMPEAGRLGHALARLPLLWTGDDSKTLDSNPALTSEFTGFEQPFVPTIAQRLSAALGILNIHRQQEDEYGEGIIRKCQEDIASILVRFPVLMHTAFRSINYQGSRQSVARVPLSYALQKATHSRLPSAEIGVDQKTLRSFANHPVVKFSLTTPLTHRQLADCGPWQEILKDSYMAGPIGDVAHARFSFVIDAHRLNDLVEWKRGKRQYGLFLDASDAPGFQDSLESKNDDTIAELLTIGLIQDIDAVLPSLESIRTSFPRIKDPKPLINTVCSGVRSHNRFTGCSWDQVINTTHKAMGIAGFEVSASTVSAHFMTSLQSSIPNEPVDTSLLAASVAVSGGAAALRDAIGEIGSSLSPMWNEALTRLETAERMTQAIQDRCRESKAVGSRPRRAAL